jgi:Holliday junction resolvase RusA-like endonuclease
MMEYRFTVNAIPKGQPRARAMFSQGRPRMWTPSSANFFKSAIADAARDAVPPELTPLRGPIELYWVAFMPRPQRLCKRSSNPDSVPSTAKPDRDNIDKAICDALQNAGVIGDDKDIWKGSQAKLYAEIDGSPRVEVCIRMTNTETV